MVRAGVRVVLWWSGAEGWWRTAHTVVPDSCPCAVGADVFPCIAFGVRQAAGESRCCALLAAYTGGESREAVVCGGARARRHVCVCMCALVLCGRSMLLAGDPCFRGTGWFCGAAGLLRVQFGISPWLRGGRTDAGRRREARAARRVWWGARAARAVAGAARCSRALWAALCRCTTPGAGRAARTRRLRARVARAVRIYNFYLHVSIVEENLN